MMIQERHVFPGLPEVGHPESYYSDLVRRADRAGNIYLHEAAKVAQYITLGLDPSLDWPAKLRYFQHALKRHCVPPPVPDEDVWLFYRSMKDLVRSHAGHEALRLASTEDDLYVTRIGLGADREVIEAEAETFFGQLIGTGETHPDWFSAEDWAQLKLIRDQWI